jgi:hypothetical protein
MVMSETKRQLKAINTQLEKLSTESKRLEEQRERLTKQDRLDKAKRAGVAVGGYYRAIPVERGGDVLEGKVKKIDTNHWRSNVQVSMLVAANGRFRERIVFLDLEQFEFEKIAAPKKAK